MFAATKRTTVILDVDEPANPRQALAMGHDVMRCVSAQTEVGGTMLSRIQFSAEPLDQNRVKLVYTERRARFWLRLIYARQLRRRGQRPFGFLTPPERREDARDCCLSLASEG